MKLKDIVSASSCCWLLATTSAAMAQQATDSVMLEEIIVTAQKRSESVNKVPLSIQAFSADDFAKVGVSDASGLSQITPAFNFSRSSANTPIYTVRGIGFNTPNLSSTSPVGVYVDEVAYAYPYMSNGPSFDLERVEVLKGPQGTLYGRNTTGGLVNFITAKPTRDPAMGARLELGNYQTYNLEGFVSGPVSDTVAIRLAARSENSDKGWQKSVSRPGDRLGKKDKLAGRAIIDWTPTEDLSVQVGASYWRDRSDTVAGQAVAFTPDSPPFAAPGVATSVRTNWKAGQADWTPENKAIRPDYKVDSRFYSLMLRADYSLSDAITLTSLTGYNDVRRKDMNDSDGTPIEVSEYQSDGRVKSFSQELRLTGDGDGYNWIFGGYYSKDKIRDDQVGYYAESSILNTLAFLGQRVPQNTYSASQIANGFNRFRNTSSQESRAISVFANGEYEISETVKLGAGLRYTDDNLDFAGCSRDYNNNTAPVWNTGVAAVVAQRTGKPFFNPGVGPNECLTYRADFSGRDPINLRKLDQENVAGRFVVNWQASEHVLAYASISRGYKSGAFPVVAANVVTQLEPARQEKVTAYEVGTKAGLLDGRLQANLAGFFYDYRDKQVFGEILDPIFVSLTRIVNVPKSEVYGLEADLNLQATRELSLRVNGSYTHTEVTKFFGYNRFGQAQDFKGSAFPYTPRWQLNGSASYDLPVSADMGLRFDTTVSYQGRTDGALGGDPEFNVDAYTIVNANVTLHALDDHWSVGIFARNLFNENYWTATDILTDTTFRVPGMVRTYGLQLSARY